MSTTITRFRAGHRNLHRLLNVFARQLRAFEQGRTPDLGLMRDIIDYLNRYAAVGDEAYEGRLIDELARSNAHFAPARLVLTTEHEAITDLGKHCLALTEDIIGGALLARPRLLIPARRYLRMYRAHLRRERLYLLRHRRETGDVLAGHLRQPLLPVGPLGEYPDLHDRVRQATATRATDELGQPVCPACTVDAAVGTAPPAAPTN